MHTAYVETFEILKKALFGALGWMGRIADYKTGYREYGVITADGLQMPA